MHSFIVQIETKPITERMTSAAIPEWFTNTIADYIDEDSARWPKGSDIVVCLTELKAEGDHFILNKEAVDRNYAGRFEEFQKSLETLRGITLEEFRAGNAHFEVYCLAAAERDKYSVYVYSDDDLIPFDEWLRYYDRHDPNAKFYIGSVIDYHF